MHQTGPSQYPGGTLLHCQAGINNKLPEGEGGGEGRRAEVLWARGGGLAIVGRGM